MLVSKFIFKAKWGVFPAIYSPYLEKDKSFASLISVSGSH